MEAVQEYQRLGQVESCFAHLQDVIELRPIWHRTAERVQGHVQVAAPALLLQRMLERRLQEADEDLSANAALQALQTVKLVEFVLLSLRSTGGFSDYSYSKASFLNRSAIARRGQLPGGDGA